MSPRALTVRANTHTRGDPPDRHRIKRSAAETRHCDSAVTAGSARCADSDWTNTGVAVNTGSGGSWIARVNWSIEPRSVAKPTYGLPSGKRRFESVSRRKGGHSGRDTPVPIPNTAVKSASVGGSTGVREPLGTVRRRPPIHTNARGIPDPVGVLHFERASASGGTVTNHTRVCRPRLSSDSTDNEALIGLNRAKSTGRRAERVPGLWGCPRKAGV